MRATAQRSRPNAERLREYTDAALPQVEQQLLAPVPVYPQMEQLTLSFGLERMREFLGPDYPLVRNLLQEDSPDSLAQALIGGSQLADPAVRKALWEGGQAAIDASHDPMIRIARLVEPEALALRRQYEDEYEAPTEAAATRIAAERFKAYGTSVYPDATSTLRLNYGTVQGWKENGRQVQPFTQLDRLFERATGADPFRLPDSWLKVKDQLDPQTPFNLSTNNDIIGGNSGSGLLDAKGEIVGLMFDGNIHAIAGAYWVDPELNRAVAVHPAIIRMGLDEGLRGLRHRAGTRAVTTHRGGCHCGKVRFEVEAPPVLEVLDCDCSMCRKTGFLHLIATKEQFRLLCGAGGVQHLPVQHRHRETHLLRPLRHQGLLCAAYASRRLQRERALPRRGYGAGHEHRALRRP